MTEKEYIKSNLMNELNHPLLQSVLAVVQDGICFLSKDFEVIYANPAMRFWYETKGDLKSKKCYELYHGRSKVCENCPSIRAVFSGKPEMEEMDYEVSSRKRGWQRVFSTPVIDKRNETMMIIEYVRDITEERRSSLNLELMQNQVEVLSDIIDQKEQERELKDRTIIENLNRSIDAVLKYLNNVLDEASYNLVESQLKMKHAGLDEGKSGHLLSDQELVIARFIASGFLSKEIAGKLNVSKKTIDYHRTNIRRKLGLKSDANLKIAILDYFSKAGIV